MTCKQVRRLIRSFIEEWTKNISKEMPIIQEQPKIHGKQNIYRK